MEPISPSDDLRAITEQLPYWVSHHYGFVLKRLQEFVDTHDGNIPWTELRKIERAKQAKA